MYLGPIMLEHLMNETQTHVTDIVYFVPRVESGGFAARNRILGPTRSRGLKNLQGLDKTLPAEVQKLCFNNALRNA